MRQGLLFIYENLVSNKLLSSNYHLLKDCEADLLSISPLSEQIIFFREIVGRLWFMYGAEELCHWWKNTGVNTSINYFNKKHFLIPVGLKVLI